MEADNPVIKTEPYEEIEIENAELITNDLEWSQCSVKTEINLENDLGSQGKYEDPKIDSKIKCKEEIEEDCKSKNIEGFDENVKSEPTIFTIKYVNCKEEEPILQDDTKSISNTKSNYNKFNCHFCDKSFNRKILLNNHLLKLHKRKIKSDPDVDLIRDTKTRKKLKDTSIKVKAKIGRTICPLCTRSFWHKTNLHDHMLQVHRKAVETNLQDFITSKIHKCIHCSYMTTIKTHITNHVNKHHGVKQEITKKYKYKSNTCQFCTRAFKTKKSLDDHLLRVHKNIVESNLDKFITSKIHACDRCSYKTTIRSSLTSHRKFYDQDSNTPEEVEICQFCLKRNKKTVVDNNSLNNYKEQCQIGFITTKISTCDTCSHKKTHAPILDPHSEANNIFKVASNWRCEFCARLLDSHILLEDHVIKHHHRLIKDKLDNYISNEIYKCYHCSYMTTLKNNLRIHVQSHNPIKSKMKSCQFCKKSFEFLNEHIFKEHRQHKGSNLEDIASRKIHKCRMCDFQTTRKTDLYEHLGKNHKI